MRTCANQDTQSRDPIIFEYPCVLIGNGPVAMMQLGVVYMAYIATYLPSLEHDKHVHGMGRSRQSSDRMAMAKQPDNIS